MEYTATNRKNLTGGAKSKFSTPGRRKTKGSIPKESWQRSFLNYQFESLPIFEVVPTIMDNVELRTEDGEPQLYLGDAKIAINNNLITLRKATEAYCKAHGGQFPATFHPNPLCQLQELYQTLIKCKPEANEIVVDYNPGTKELEFYEHIYSEYPEGTLAFVNVDILDKLEGPYRQFFKEFLSYMQATIGIVTPDEHYDFGFMLQIYTDGEAELEDESEEFRELFNSYNNGHARDLIKEVDECPWQHLEYKREETQELLNTLIQNAPSEELKDLLYLAQEGLEIMRNEKMSSYQDTRDYCELSEFDTTGYCDEEFFPVIRLFCLCYGTEETDELVSRTINDLNNSGGSYMQEELFEPHQITENYDHPLTGTQFPARWFSWFEKYNQAVWIYESSFKNDE